MARTENFDAGHGMEHHNTTPAPEKPINPLVSGKMGLDEVSQPPSGIRYKTADTGNRFSTGSGIEFDTESVKAKDLTKDHAFLCACGRIHSSGNVGFDNSGTNVSVNSSHGHVFPVDKDITVIKGDMDRETRKKINKYPWEAI
jgi:hypothetical protein